MPLSHYGRIFSSFLYCAAIVTVPITTLSAEIDSICLFPEGEEEHQRYIQTLVKSRRIDLAVYNGLSHGFTTARFCSDHALRLGIEKMSTELAQISKRHEFSCDLQMGYVSVSLNYFKELNSAFNTKVTEATARVLGHALDNVCRDRFHSCKTRDSYRSFVLSLPWKQMDQRFFQSIDDELRTTWAKMLDLAADQGGPLRPAYMEKIKEIVLKPGAVSFGAAENLQIASIVARMARIGYIEGSEGRAHPEQVAKAFNHLFADSKKLIAQLKASPLINPESPSELLHSKLPQLFRKYSGEKLEHEIQSLLGVEVSSAQIDSLGQLIARLNCLEPPLVTFGVKDKEHAQSLAEKAKKLRQQLAETRSKLTERDIKVSLRDVETLSSAIKPMLLHDPDEGLGFLSSIRFWGQMFEGVRSDKDKYGQLALVSFDLRDAGALNGTMINYWLRVIDKAQPPLAMEDIRGLIFDPAVGADSIMKSLGRKFLTIQKNAIKLSRDHICQSEAFKCAFYATGDDILLGIHSPDPWTKETWQAFKNQLNKLKLASVTASKQVDDNLEMRVAAASMKLTPPQPTGDALTTALANMIDVTESGLLNYVKPAELLGEPSYYVAEVNYPESQVLREKHVTVKQ